MLRAPTPIDILRTQATTLAGLLPRLYDGEIEAIHDARVNSRRIREVLPLTGAWYPQDAIEDLEDTFRRIGRSLGRVRDADVRMALLAFLEARIPPAAAPSLQAISRQHEHKRLPLLRKLIKRFERLDVARILEEIAAGRTRARRPWASIAGGWRDHLRRTVIERAGAARESVDHATGVYFPNRMHAARIAVKKLRYAMEIARETGAGFATKDSIRQLRRTQAVLGDLHDRQVLIDDLPKKAKSGPVEIDSDQIALVIQILEAECRDLHAQFLKRRPQVLDICRRFEPAHPDRSVAITPAATALVISSALYLWRRTRATEPPLGERGVTVRIPIPDAAAAGR